MKAAYIEQVGPPQAIHYGDLPLPTVGQKEILVKVEAVTVDGVDTYIRSGRVKTALPLPALRTLPGIESISVNLNNPTTDIAPFPFVEEQTTEESTTV